MILELLETWTFIVIACGVCLPLLAASLITIREYYRILAAVELVLVPLTFVIENPTAAAIRAGFGLLWWWLASKYDDNDRGRRRRKELADKLKAKLRKFAPSPVKPAWVGAN